ncbi:MAG: SufD family Fe-S cluster assembly protein [Oscillospiraceae bacterium]|nr:SufD family Fe-S cluster assembly protein [Oscillospiraceae bacterium]
MRKKQNILINEIPAHTFGWLGANSYATDDTVHARAVPTVEIEGGVVRSEPDEPIETGAGKTLASVLDGAGIPKTAYAFISDGGILRLGYHDPNSDGMVTADRVYVTVADGVTADLVLKIGLEERCGTRTIVSVEAKLGKGSALRITQIEKANAAAELISDLGVLTGDGSEVEIVKVITGEGNIVDGYKADLSGSEAKLRTRVGYDISGNARLDMNHVSRHCGRRTDTDIKVYGVLRDDAFKLFRGTIDFIRGCSGAVGNETEDVLLLSENVRNQTIPLILCGEEDVEGNHGATIGRVSDEIMYYLGSRGLNEDKIFRMMAEAKMNAVISEIKDDKTRKNLEEERGQ